MSVLAEGYVHLIGDWNHWAFELSVEAVTGALVYPPGRWLLRRWRDREHARIDAEHGVTPEMHAHPMRYVVDGQERDPQEVFVK